MGVSSQQPATGDRQPHRPGEPLRNDSYGRFFAVPAALLAIVVWLGLWKFLGDHTWTWGRVTFWVLLAIAALLISVNLRSVGAWLRPGARGGAVLVLILTVAAAYLVARQSRVVGEGFGPPWAERLWDVAQGAYDFNRALRDGENPYRARAQYHPVQGMWGHSTDAAGREYLFGWRYYYGYPHFPMSALWFAPFVGVTGGYNDIRVGNLVYFVLNLALLNAILFIAGGRRVLPCLVGSVAFLGVDFQVSETFQLGIVDQAFSVPLLAAILLALTSCWRSAGVFAGLALASKHFPAIPVVLALAIFVHRGGRLRRFAVPAVLAWLVVMAPFVLWDYEAFVSATVLHHLHEAGAGDNTALYYFLPDAWKTPFRITGLVGIAAVYAWIWSVMVRRAAALFLATALVCLLINAFYPVMHLNHLESILAFASVSFALGLARDER